MQRLFLAPILGLLVAMVLAACGEATPETVVVEKEVIREVPVEVVVKEEVIKEVQVPGETIVVKEEVIKEVQVPGETVVVTKEVPVEVSREVVKVVERIVEAKPKAFESLGEAPMLAELVRAGKLSPVEERVPKNPMIIPVVESIGRYGGEIRRAYRSDNISCDYGRPIRDGLVRPNREANKIVMAVAKSIEPSSDGKTWTVNLREGMKWSDGAPFTADDFLFQFERLHDDDLTPAEPAWIRVGETTMTASKVDDTTVQLITGLPNWAFLDVQLIADGDCGRVNGGDKIPYAPAHYLKQFFPKYADGGAAALNERAKADGLETWVQLYLKNSTDIEGVDKPTTRPFVLDSGITGKRIIANRNAYFYAVDPEGNQLPYIDRWVYDRVQDKPAINLKAIGGELDFQSRHIEMANYTVYKEHEETGGFRVLLWPSVQENDAAVSINVAHQGPQGEYYRMEDFRHALSWAIDRDKINQVAVLGTGVVRNLMPPRGHPYYPGPQLEFKYMDHDLEKANEILDGIMPKKNADGYRLMSNGEPINILLWANNSFVRYPDIAEMIVNDWKEVGIMGEVKADQRQALSKAQKDNTMDAHIFQEISAGLIFSMPGRLIPILASGHVSRWALGYSHYVGTDGERGVMPTPDVEELIALYRRGPTLPDAERAEVAKEIFRIHAERQYILNIFAQSAAQHGVIIVKDGLMNVPEQAANSWPHRQPSTGYPVQFYWK